LQTKPVYEKRRIENLTSAVLGNFIEAKNERIKRMIEEFDVFYDANLEHNFLDFFTTHSDLKMIYDETQSIINDYKTIFSLETFEKKVAGDTISVFGEGGLVKDILF
jgi:hypothetical protein